MPTEPPFDLLSRTEQGFLLYGLRNEHLEIWVAPELGAKVVSLINRTTGREWMSSPDGAARLFRNKLFDDFSAGTMSGWDECLPTISPCQFRGRDLPDHGEVWSVPWAMDQNAFRLGRLTTSVDLAVTPLAFSRSIQLNGNSVELDYELTNLGSSPEEYLWSMHPLVPVFPGMKMAWEEVPATQPKRPAWAGQLDLAPDLTCEKIHIAGIASGSASFVIPPTNESLTFRWDTLANDSLGVWLTRGGWNGHHHAALEPCNGSPDDLRTAAASGRCGTIATRETRRWNVSIQLNPGDQGIPPL